MTEPQASEIVPDLGYLWEVKFLDGNSEPVEPDYLFRTTTMEIEYYVIQEEMAQLNCYCALCLNGTLKRLTGYKTQLAELEAGTGEPICDPDYGDVTDYVVLGLTDVIIPSWEEINNLFARATCLILLFCFAEKSLKSLCATYSASGKPPKASKYGGGAVNTYIQFLQRDCGLDFSDATVSTEFRSQCKAIRNAFAHGDWDAVKAVSDISLQNAFANFSSLFESIETALIKQRSTT